MRQGIGLLVELGVGQLPALVHRRRRIRRARGLRFDARVQGLRVRVGLGGGVPLLQLGLFGRRHQGKIADLQRGIFQPLLQQPGKALRQGEHFVAVDLGSTNGSYVDGERVIGRTELVNGSVITMGRTRITFRLLTPKGNR